MYNILVFVMDISSIPNLTIITFSHKMYLLKSGAVEISNKKKENFKNSLFKCYHLFYHNTFQLDQ